MGFAKGRHIGDLHIRLSREEMDDLQKVGALQGAPVSSIIRAMVRDYLIKWRREHRLELELGIVTWQK